jgi:CheY-like chemotaxis protein
MSTVLVVDDEQMTRDALCRVLRLAGYEAVPAADPVAAAEALRGRRPDVILLDVDPTGPTGAELIQTVRDDPAGYGVPVVLLTGAADGRCVGGDRRGPVRAVSSLGQMFRAVQDCTGSL